MQDLYQVRRSLAIRPSPIPQGIPEPEAAPIDLDLRLSFDSMRGNDAVVESVGVLVEAYRGGRLSRERFITLAHAFGCKVEVG
jgi:hypothetical protein